MHFLQTSESRDMLLRVWPAMSEVMPEPTHLRQIIQKYRVPVTIFIGAFDKIILPSKAGKFKNGLDTVQLQLLEKGHRIIDEETAKQIAGSLL